MSDRREQFPADLRSVRSGRHFVRDVLLDWDLEQLVDDAQLCVSEIVTNAVKHAGTELTITVRRDDAEAGAAVVVDVHDGLAGAELEARPMPLDATSGRGLHIVATISQDWGVRQAGEGKIIWFRLPVPAAGGGNADADVLSMGGRRAGTEAAADRADSGAGSSESAMRFGGQRARTAG